MGGSTLRIRNHLLPLAALGAFSLAGADEYTVAPGETLSEIAAATGTTTAAIAGSNGLSDPDRILAGQTISIPAAAASPRALAPAPTPVTVGRDEVGALIDRTARANGWNPAIVKAIAWQESGWTQARISHAGAVGVMQVIPATGEFISTHLVGRDLDLHDPDDNVLAGVVYLQHLWERTDGDVEHTLAGYYQGLRSVSVNGRYQDTERYIANVLALRERFR
jgi:N-acetylmuramoyl-L-alanine amidase